MTAKKTNPEKKSHVLAWFAILRKRRSKLLTKVKLPLSKIFYK